MKKLSCLAFALSLFLSGSSPAQQALDGQRMPFVVPQAGMNETFVEPSLPNTAVNTSAWAAIKNGLQAGFISTGIRMPRHDVPGDTQTQETLTGWRGERLNAQFILWSKTKTTGVHVAVGGFTNFKGSSIDSENITPGFVRYIVSDATAGACGSLKGKDLTPFLVVDPIDTIQKLDIDAMSVQPVWLSVNIPREARPGSYQGAIQVYADGLPKPAATLHLQINVLDETLPPPLQWKFHLDLAQYPLNEAAYYQLKPWSEASLDRIRPAMQMLRDAGQKVITTFVFWDYWNGSDRGIKNAYIQITKTKAGEWKYDYTNFDTWVNFMMSIGINRQINCFGMVPWVCRFYYFDENTQTTQSIQAEPGTAAYEAFWRPLLESFRDHLKQKGWFDITTLGIDERPLGPTQSAIALIKKADPNFKITFTGKYYPEIQNDVYDYSLTLKQIPPDVLSERQEQGKITTYYTCCWELQPNTFTCSAPNDAAYMSWFAAANNFDGYLRYAYDMWDRQSLNDSRNSAVPAGDTFLIYPGARSSIRFEKLVEGIEDYEKIRILEERYRERGDQTSMAKIKKLLSSFTQFGAPPAGIAETVTQAHDALNAMS